MVPSINDSQIPSPSACKVGINGFGRIGMNRMNRIQVYTIMNIKGYH